MKIKYILGTLIFLALISTIGLGSATIFTIPITLINSDSFAAQHGYTVNIIATYDDSTGNITYTDLNSTTNQGFNNVAYNDSGAYTAALITGTPTNSLLSVNLYNATNNAGLTWDNKSLGYAQGQFGSFNEQYGAGNNNPTDRYKQVIVHLKSPYSSLVPNDKLKEVAIHYTFADDNSCFATSNGGNPSTSIPKYLIK